MGKNTDAVRHAYERGYRVTPEGEVLSPKGTLRKLQLHKGTRTGPNSQHYATFSVAYKGVSTPVFVHRLQAFQKFGERALVEGVQTRHKNEDCTDNSWWNIILGNASENAMDRQSEARQEHAMKAAAVQQKHKAEFIDTIRLAHASGMSYRQLEVKFGLSRSTLSYYLSKKAARTTVTYKL